MEFRLLVETHEPRERLTITLNGRQWSLTDPLDINSDIPSFVCISYIWGTGRAPNPFHPSITMSDHTAPALTTAIRNHPCAAIWVDAFCVPTEPTRKKATLESMGFIYGHAATVAVVLVKESLAAMKRLCQLETATMLDAPDVMDMLNADMWIRSVWTYQEVVNSSRLLFVGEGVDDTTIEGESFLNHFGHCMTSFRRATGMNGFAFRERYPYLDAFEDLVADWFVASFQGRSAFQVMSGMFHRLWHEDANYFYSMIGAITDRPSPRRSRPTIENLAESFMAVCEEKGDFSFIFSTNERDTRPGLGWRPAPQILRPILSWHVFGEGQKGQQTLDGLKLSDMAFHPLSATLDEDVRKDVQGFLAKVLMKPQDPADDSPAAGLLSVLGLMRFLGSVQKLMQAFFAKLLMRPQDRVDDLLAADLLSMLKAMGFTGSENHIVTNNGLFFPQSALPSVKVEVWASTTIRWTFGSPGLAITTDAGGHSYIPGVFAGVSNVEGSPVFI